jgi:glycosyltransferase involved in cell wall biosynthesis
MRVTISVLGRFHAFHLAQQLQQRNALAQLLTSYPTFEVVKYGIRSELVSSFVWLEAMRRVWWKTPLNARWNTQYFFSSLHDRIAARALRPGADLFVGFSGSSLKTLRRAKALGMIGVIERSSSHMLYQQAILTEEYARLGMRFSQTHPKVIDQEIAEYHEADAISTPSSFAKRTFLAEGVPEEKLIMVPFGTDLSAFRPLPKEDDKFRVIFCAGLTIRKGVHYLLQAFSELRLPDAELWLVGSVSEEIRPFLERYHRSDIVVHGHKRKSELSWYYSQGTIFCLPSLEEGMAMVQLQAMACGLPLLCTTNTGGEDIIREGVDGFVVPIRDVGALKAKILWAYDHRSQCLEMGRAARERVGGSFSWNDYGDRILSAYRRLAEAKARGVAKNVPEPRSSLAWINPS